MHSVVDVCVFLPVNACFPGGQVRRAPQTTIPDSSLKAYFILQIFVV